MKITRLRTQLVQIPFDPPVGLGMATLHTSGLVLVLLESDQGVVGEGLVFTFNGQRLAVLDEMVRSFEPLLIGLDPQLSGSFTHRAWADLRNYGNAGISVMGLAGVECALLDLRAKLLNVNVARLLGAYRTALPIYHSSELWVTLTIDQLQRAASEHVRQGYRAMKMRLIGDIEKDVERVRAVREAIGADVGLLADANQKLTVSQAIRLGRCLEELNLIWLEEPVAAHDHAGEAQVAAALDTPIASAESVYTSRGIMEVLQHRSCDVVMPDLLRMGGPVEWLKAAHLAEGFSIPVSNHTYSEMSLSLMASIPNGSIVEFMPWVTPIYLERIELDKQGQAIVPDRPGLGFGFDPAVIRRYAVT
jgi:L-alanine-DL-glutamate epimerase-like enolase superfamily enzyme